ncbi:MAG: HYR domain-containing protein, partial [Nocardioidaceae bacterium]
GPAARGRLNGCDDDTFISDDTIDAQCLSAFGEDFEWAQTLLSQDYTFFVPAPPKPSDGALVVWEAEDRCSEVPDSPGNPPGDNVEDVNEADDGAENIGAPSCIIPDQVTTTVQNGQPGINVTVKADSSGIDYPSNNYVAFAKRYKVAWDETPAPAQRPRVFSVSFNQLKVFDDSEEQGNDGEWVVSLTANQRWIHPVRGHGDDDAPFWEDGALDDGCDDDDSCTYSIGESLTDLGIVPGEPLHVKMRGWEDDEGFITGNQNFADVLPAVNVFHPLSELPGSFNKVPNVDISGLGGDDETGGDYRLLYSVSETTPAWPTLGTLTIGDPRYGPNEDTGDTTRVAAATPITYADTDGTSLQYKFWKDGTTKPAAWDTDPASPFELAFPAGSIDGRYTIEFRPVSAGGVVGETRSARVERDTTPPVLTLPDDIEVFQTETAGTHVGFTFSATDSLPGPVEASCDWESGDLFPAGKNAPQVTSVTCTATDAVDNTATDTFTVTVTSPFGYVNDFVVLATEWAKIETAARVETGNVGVYDASAGIPNTGGIEVAVATSALLTGGPQIAAHSVSLANDVHAGDVFRVDKLVASPSATYTEKIGYVPLFFGGMPAFPSYTASGPNRNLSGVQTLAAGNYGTVSTGPNAVVTLSGGVYRMRSLELKPGAKLHISAASELRVAGRVLVASGTTVGPAPASGLSAKDLVIYSSAVDGPPNKPADAIQFGSMAVIAANAYAPNGTVSVGTYTSATGAFVGKRVVVASNAVVNRDSAFVSPE